MANARDSSTVGWMSNGTQLGNQTAVATRLDAYIVHRFGDRHLFLAYCRLPGGRKDGQE